jgi:serine/threonine protein kinase
MVKGAQVASPQEFLAVLQKCGLLTPQQLTDVQPLAAEANDSKSFARQLVARSILTKWQATQLFNGFSQFAIGKYRLLDLLGAGRIGREFLAEHIQLGRRVALKLVSRDLTSDPRRLKTFLEEYRRAGSLDHPHLVHSFDVDQEGQRYFVVTEYIDGEDLHKRVQRLGRAAPHEAIDFCIQAAEGLAHAAAKGVLHGDLKPSNLLRDKDGVLKVSDLGFAHLVERKPAERGVPGSKELPVSDLVEYVAPEAMNQTGGDLDVRTDIYSLGQILYFLVAGEAPSTTTPEAADRADKLRSLQPQLPVDVISLYAQFTAADASARPADWNEALGKLRNVSLPAAGTLPAAEEAAAPVIAIDTTNDKNGGKRKPPMAKAVPLSNTEFVSAEASGDELTLSSDDLNDSQPFVLNLGDTNSRQRGSAKKGAAASGNAAAASADEAKPVMPPMPAPAATAGEKKPPPLRKLSPKLLLGLLGGGIAAVLLLGSLTVWMLTSGGEAQQQVAQAQPVKPGGKAKSPSDDAAAESEEEVNPEEVNPPTPEAAVAATAGNADPKLAPEAAASASAMEVPPTEPAPAADPPSPDKPAGEPPAPPKTDPATPDPAKTEPAPPQPEPPAPAPAAPPPPQVKPFEKLPAVVALPPVPTAEKPAAPATLGEIQATPDQLVSVLLYGGENASRGKSVFTLQNANGGTDPRKWELAVTGKSESDNKVVATFRLDENAFTFEWTPAAVEEPLAPFAANCQLQLSVARDVHSLALRVPVEVEPVTIDMEKGSTLKIPLENAPSGKNLRVELVGLDPASFPNPEFQPQASVEGAKGTMYVWLGETAEQRNFGLRVDTAERGKSLEVRFQPYFRLPAPAPPVKATKKFFLEQSYRLEQAMALLSANSAAIQASKLSQERKDQDKTLTENELKAAQAQHGRLKAAADLYQRLDDSAQIHVRVSYVAGDGKVLLAQTIGAPPAEAASAEQAK